MNKLLQKVAKIFLGLSMAAGVGVAISSNKNATKTDAGATDGTACLLWDSSGGYSANASFTTSSDGAIKWKNSATNTYSKPTRIYANNTVTIAIADDTKASSINGIIISANDSSQSGSTNNTKNATWTASGTSASVSTASSSGTVTATTSGTVTQVTIKPSSQVRWNSVTVYYTPAGGGTTTYYNVYYDANVTDPSEVSGMPSTGSAPENDTYTLDSVSTPLRSGYLFGGWAASELSTTPITTIDIEEDDVTVYAIWIVDTKITVTFVGGTDTGTAGGQGQSDSLTKSGITMACDSCYTTSGSYRFYSGATITISSSVGNIKYIEFTGGDGSYPVSRITGDGYSNGVWEGDAASVELTSSGGQSRSAQVIVKYEPLATYTVNFAIATGQSGYGTLSASSISNVPEGSSITVSGNKVTINETTITATPTQETAQYTYGFDSWDNTSGTITANRTITASFTRSIRSYDVTGSINNGSLTVPSQIQYGGSLNVTINPDSGYKYPDSSSDITVTGATISSYNNSTGVLALSGCTGAVTVTATCEPNGQVFTVTYNYNNGSSNTTESIVENGHPTFPNASKEFNTFNGWKTDGDNTLYTSSNASSYTVVGDVTFVAQYTPITYTVTYNANGATSGTVPTDSSSPYNGGSTVTVLGNTGNLVKTNHTFNGWNTSSDGTGLSYEAGDTFVIASSTTLYAQWTDNTKTLVITRSCFPSGVLAYNVTDEWSATASNGDTVSGEGDLYATANQTTMQTKNSGVSTGYHNTSVMPGYITKIELDVASGTDRTYNVFLSKTSITDITGLTSVGTVNGASALEISSADKYCYFWLECTGGASYLNSITVSFVEDKTPSVELSETSIELKTNNSDGIKVSAIVRNVTSPTYSWEANNNNVTLTGSNTSEVTIKPNTNDTASSTVTLTVGGATPALSPVSVSVSIVPPGPGETAETAFTVSQAISHIDSVIQGGEDSGNDGKYYYVTGIVSSIYSSSVNNNGQISYYISSDGSTSGDQFEAYNGKGLNGASFTSIFDVEVGDTVIIYGLLKFYSGTSTYEFEANNYLVSQIKTPQVQSITLTPNVITLAPQATGNIVDLFSSIVINQEEGSTKTVNDITWSSDDSAVFSISDGTYTVAGAHKTSTTLNALINGRTYGSATINVIDPDHPFILYDTPIEWNLVDDPSTLVAGDKVIITGVKNNVTYAAGTYSSGNNVPADTTNTLTVSGTKVTGVVDTMIYTLENGTESGSVAFKDSDGKYLYAASSSSNHMKSQSSINGNASFILDSDGTVTAQGSNSHNKMRYNNSGTSNLFSCYDGSTGTLVTFYKMTGGVQTLDLDNTILTLVRSKMSIYVDEHGDTQYGLSICSYTGGSDLSNWGTSVGSGFTQNIISTYHLADARANRDGNDVEKFLSAYDYVVENYGADYDFLGRIASGKVTPINESKVLLSSIFGKNTNTVAIIVIISMVSVTAIGGYFFLRKRKENI